jgi:hypothetical protein
LRGQRVAVADRCLELAEGFLTRGFQLRAERIRSLMAASTSASAF